MKTKQEIRQMVNTCNVYRSCALCPYRPKDISRFIGDRWKGGCPNYDRQLVYAMGKGYGDVSEYKAEIEDLKDEIIYLERKIAIRDNALKDRDKAIEMLEGKQDAIVKQAKIDILDKLKERLYSIFVTKSSPLGDITVEDIAEDIDELMAEVQNE